MIGTSAESRVTSYMPHEPATYLVDNVKISYFSPGIYEDDNIVLASSTPEMHQNLPPNGVSNNWLEVKDTIALCESGNTHYRGNYVIRGEQVNEDLGKFQINPTYHSEEARSMNIDLYTEEGNEQFARHLFERDGIRHWSASEKCIKARGIAYEKYLK